MVAMALIIALAAGAPANADATAVARPATATVSMHQDSWTVAQAQPVTVAIEISGGSEKLWTGSLRVGGMSGASFSESMSEFEDPCPGRAEAVDRYYGSGRQLSFNINRQMSPENPDQFWVNVTWARPVPRCEGSGTNTVGFNRLVSLAPGQTLQLGGEMGLQVRLTRQR